MIVGKYPFYPTKAIQQQNNHQAKLSETIIKIINGTWSIPSNVNISKETELLLHQLLSPDPFGRGTAFDILHESLFFNTKNKRQGPQNEDDDIDDELLNSVHTMNVELKNQNISFIEH